ncbi:MAG: transposase [Bryobacteraceae bacterium]
MQLTPLAVITQFAHVLQQELFPELEVAVGPLDKKMELLTAVMTMTPLEPMLSAHRSFTGRPAKDRTALATAFLAKAVFNLPTTRDLIARLRVDAALRRFCGWYSVDRLPHESKFSRANARVRRHRTAPATARSHSRRHPESTAHRSYHPRFHRY